MCTSPVDDGGATTASQHFLLNLRTCGTTVKRKRESLDRRLAKLTREQQMELLIYGEGGAGDAAEQLAMQARAVRGLAKALKITDSTTSEGYDALLNDLRKRVADLCTRALLDDDTAFFKSVARGLRKARTKDSAW